MKKIKGCFLLITISLLISFTFISCVKEQDSITENQENKVKEEIVKDEEVSTVIPEEESAGEDFLTEESIIEKSPLSIRDIPSTELVKEIQIGWNLGNTLDATGGGALLTTETSWGNPKTSEEVFKVIKESGFQIVRIPVSWGNHLSPDPDYEIHKIWLERVKEVVDYGINNDLYVILNMHHEEWHYPSYDNLESATTILTKVWTQIAEEFKEYDEHLIFEGMNEPRLKGTPLEWNGGNEEARDAVNQLNKSFVDTIRKAGGNNPYRHLMIPTYAASADPKTWKDFVIPEDEKIIVSIHSYTPYNFALNINGTSEWSSENLNDTRDIDNLMNNLYNSFISKGHPVIIGEFGAMEKNNTEARVNWARYYMERASGKGIPCIWWDNGAFTGGGELFGLLDRRQSVWKHQDIVDALMEGIIESN